MSTRLQRRGRAGVRRLSWLAVSALVLTGTTVLGQTPAAAQAAIPGGFWERTDSLNVVRYDHSTTLLANGKVLAAAGRTLNVTPVQNFSSAEIYDPISEEWTLTGSLNTARFSHTGTLLPDGKVLVAGGFGPQPSTGNQPVLDTAELYDPATGTWMATGSMNVRRALHVAVLLTNGKVLVAGGRTCDQPPPATCGSAFRTNTAELYDPATGTWTLTGSMNADRHTTAGVRLLDGRVIVPAGFTATTPNGSNTADIYDPATGTWSLTGNLNRGRSRSGAMLLNDGRVMTALGFNGPSVPNPTTEIYNPATNTWTFADNIDFPFSRFNFHYGVLPNGKALVAGGQFFAGQANQGIIRDSHIYDPATNDWTNTAPLNDPHGTPGGVSNSERMVILSASPHSYVADPAVCGRHCGKAFVVGQSTNGSTELFNATGTCFGFNATIAGTDGVDTLLGTAGRDVIVGYGSDDRIFGDGGDDIICAGDGNDSIAGDAGSDIVLGGEGLDRVSGAAGNDALFGEAADDQLAGGTDTDTADGGVGTDACSGEVTRNCP